MNQTDSDHALALLLAEGYDDYDYYSRYDHQEDEGEETKRKRKKTEKVEKADGLNSGKFTEVEIGKFKEGLELYGRDWSRVT
jgi:hypothetical protein